MIISFTGFIASFKTSNRLNKLIFHFYLHWRMDYEKVQGGMTKSFFLNVFTLGYLIEFQQMEAQSVLSNALSASLFSSHGGKFGGEIGANIPLSRATYSSLAA